ncbi:MAG: aminopeptidase [Actinomycetota bacterium]|nr:aminopeptidase [Actinomycetota bacterium]
MIDADAFATLLCEWCLEPAEGNQVLVSTTTLAVPVAAAMHRAVIKRGAWPLLRLTPTEVERDFYELASDAQLDCFAPLDLVQAQSVDMSLGIDAPANVRQLAGIDPARIARAARARRPLQEARMGRRWCVTLWPTSALAQQAGMGDREYAAFVGRALFLDGPDPAAAWRELSAAQARVVERLSTAHEFRIQAEGTDLRLSVGGRTWINSDGRRNMPSGEVFTGPHEDSAEGTIRFTVPSNRGGTEVAGAELTFRAGEVVAARADRGEDHLREALAIDPGARFLGELGIGTNRGIDCATGSTLLDEKIAGTVHLALGRSYPETGAVNDSALHWDLICDLRPGGELSADGEAIVRNGEFTL